MSNLPYPPDGGLKAPVRTMAETPSAFAVIAAHYGLRTTRQQSQPSS